MQQGANLFLVVAFKVPRTEGGDRIDERKRDVLLSKERLKPCRIGENQAVVEELDSSLVSQTRTGALDALRSLVSQMKAALGRV